MRRVLLAALLMAFQGPALADYAPRFDIAIFCQANAAANGGIERCVSVEERNRTFIMTFWSAFPDQRKHFCAQSLGFMPRERRSYAALTECIDFRATS